MPDTQNTPSNTVDANIDLLRSEKPCLNCGIVTGGAYCAVCGQPAKVIRLRWSNLMNELKERLLGLDGRFFRTLRKTFSNPGEMAKTYIAGNRVRYIGPIGAFLIALTLYLLILSAMGLEFRDLIELGANYQADQSQSPQQSAAMEAMYEYFNSNFRSVSFFTVFVVGFLIWIFNRKMKLNLVEHMVFPLYTEGISFIIGLPQLLFINTEYVISASLLTFFLTQSFLVYAYTTFDTKGSLLKRIIKGSLIRFLSLVMLFVASIAATVVWFFNNMDLFKAAP